jgi:hypothetical protein
MNSGNDGGASINEGSCAFGQLDSGTGTGLDIAALSDADPDYAGSCGRCYEGARFFEGCRGVGLFGGVEDAFDVCIAHGDDAAFI